MFRQGDPRLLVLVISLSIVWLAGYLRFGYNCYLGKYDNPAPTEKETDSNASI